MEIPEYIFQQKRMGILKIQAHAGAVCPHEFIAFIDQTGTPRGYEKIDYQMQFTARSVEEHKVTDNLFLEDLLETLGDVAAVRIFHAFLFNFKIFIVITPTDNPQFVDKLNDLFSSFFPVDINVSTLAESIDRKKFATLDLKESQYLILNTSGVVINSPWGDQKKFDFETDLIKKALEIIDDRSQVTVIQQEIINLKKKAEILVTLLENVKKIYDDELKDKLSKQFHTKPTNYLLELYIQFIKYRMPDKEPLLNKIQNHIVEKVRENLW
jgi:hypothetical protein